MDILQIYASCLGAIILALFVYRILCQLGIGPYLRYLVFPFRRCGRKLLFAVLKYIIYPQVFGCRSRLWVIIQAIYWAGTITCNFLFTHSFSEIGARAGHLAIINFVPLLLAGRIHLAADVLGISFRPYIQAHSAFGAMTCVQAVLHTVVSLRTKAWEPGTLIQFYGLLGVSGICLSLAVLLIRRWIYQLFLKLHYVAAILVLYAVWRHVHLQKTFSRLYVLVCSVIFALSTATHWLMLGRRNITLDKFGSRARLQKVNSIAAELIIPVNRPFRVQAGMIVYIWLPSVSKLSFLQSHPFPITWWETNAAGKATSISLLVEKKDGFTKHLLKHKRTEFATWIDGPYDGTECLNAYRRVLMVASGSGIAAQIPYIRQLLADSTDRKIFVAWEIDDINKLDWVYHWMDKLLMQDIDSYILRFGLYIPDNAKSEPQVWNSKNERIWKLHGHIDPWKVMGKDFWKAKGRGLVTVSARKDIRKALKRVVQSEMEDIIDLIELSFQPTEEHYIHKLGGRQTVEKV